MKNPFDQMSDIMEFRVTNDFLEDEMVENALLKLTSVLARQDIDPIRVARHVVETEAMAAAFRIKYKFYATIGKEEPDSRNKRELYATLHAAFHDLSASIKYLAK